MPRVAFATTPEHLDVEKAAAGPLDDEEAGGVLITVSERTSISTSESASEGIGTGIFSSDNSNSTSRQSKSPSIRGNLTRQHKDRDPSTYYEILYILGAGSMGSVAKVRKKQSMIGGSAWYSMDEQRDKLLHTHKCFTLPFVGGMFRWCLKASTDEMLDSSSMLHVTPTSSLRSTSSSKGAAPSGDLDPSTKRTRRLSNGSGSGSTSSKSCEMIFAMKSIHLKYFKNQEMINELLNEVEILKTLDHPHIVRVMETFDYREQIFVVMDLCSGGDLYTRDPYTEEEAARICGSFLSAVAYMHAHGV